MSFYPNKYKALVTVLLVFLVTSCSTIDPYTGEQKTSRATKGAGIGAAVGAAVGLITGDNSKQRKRQALILAGVGAVAGGAVGNYQDKQEMELRQQLEGTGVSVTRIGDDITLNMPGNVTFAVDSADISAGFYDVLKSVAVVLKKFDKTFVEVAGHTDSSGSDAYNRTLSQQRADSVASYLKTQNILADRFITIGAGETRPIATNDTAAGRQQNRRVEITIVPVTAG